MTSYAKDPQRSTGSDDPDDEGISVALTKRRLITLIGFLVLAILALYLLAPRIAGLDDTWAKIEDGRPEWLAAGVVFTVGMFVGNIWMFRGVFVDAGSQRLGWRASYEITMAGLAASRLFAAGGAGGLVVTAWALRRSGMSKRLVADKTIALLVLTYMPYALAAAICGFGLYFGIFPGNHPFSLTFLPAVIAVVVIAIFIAIAFVPIDLPRRLKGVRREGGFGRLAQRFAVAPVALSAGVRDALGQLRRGEVATVGAILFWGFQIAVLWAGFHAFGNSPPIAVLVQGFFVGMLGNLLPMPGGVGGVEAGMVGAFAAFGVDAGLALVAVLVFRAFTFWLPMLPGVIAYFQLLRTVERWKAARVT